MVNLYYEKKFEIFESDCVFRCFFWGGNLECCRFLECLRRKESMGLFVPG